MHRRTLLTSVLAGTMVCMFPRFASAAKSIESQINAANRRFSILYDGDKIGAHVIAHSAATGQTRITTEIDLVVKALFFTVFAYSHRSEEIWREGRLISLNSETVEDGETLLVTGAAKPQGFRIVGKSGPYIAAPGALTSNNLWTPAVLEQDTIIDAQHGGIIGVSARKIGDESIVISGRQVRATRHHFITPFLAGSLWYDELGRWVRGDFERDGSRILYRLDD